MRLVTQTLSRFSLFEYNVRRTVSVRSEKHVKCLMVVIVDLQVRSQQLSQGDVVTASSVLLPKTTSNYEAVQSKHRAAKEKSDLSLKILTS